MIADLLMIMDRLQRRQLLILFAAVLVNALLEFLSLGSVFALSLNLLAPKESSGPELSLKALFGWSIFDSDQSLSWLAVAVVVAYLVKSCFGMAVTWLRSKLTYEQTAIFSERLLRSYLSKDWPFFLTKNASVLASQVTATCNELTIDLINDGAIFATEFLVCIALVIGLALVNPTAVAVLAILLGITAIIIHVMLRPSMRRLGESYWNARIRANRTTEMALGCAREVLLYRLQDTFCDRLQHDLQSSAHAGALVKMLIESPRQLIELCAVTGFMGFLAWESANGRSISAILVVASVFAAAAFRLIPSITRLSSAAASLSSIRPAFEMLKADLAISLRTPPPPSILRFERDIELRNLGFCYPGAVNPALSNVSVRIRRGSSFAIVGRSGAGKSTLTELLLGLLEPTEGEILIDGLRLTPSNKQGWQDRIGYVPQLIFVCDDTMAANIAFGIPPEQIDATMVKRAADLAGLASFVESETTDGYDTVVGDNGIMLSGGQRQRLAIARALYRQPEVLVFDEATSALDNITEAIVNESIEKLGSEVTIILVAHRISSVRHCSKILVLEKGEMSQLGSFEQLCREEGVFKELLHAATEERKLALKNDTQAATG